MIPRISRGHSFKKLAAYLSHDHAESGAPHPQTSARVGFVRTANFEDDPGGDAAMAAQLMAWTWRGRDALKADAGIKPGGRRSEAPPVWHMSLSWAIGEQVDEATMMEAAREALAAAGLGIDKGHQTVFVEHTDTKHRHVHVVVNLVHPVTGKQSNPFRDQPKLQQWARDYEQRRGQVFCQDREAKYAEIERQRNASDGVQQFSKAARPKRKRQPRRGDPDYQPKADRFHRDRMKARQPRQPRGGGGREEFQQQAGPQAGTRAWEGQPPPQPSMRMPFRQAADDGTTQDPSKIIEALTAQHSTFTRRDLARHLWTRCADADEFRALMAKVEASPEFVRLARDERGTERFTARDLQAIERRMMDDATALHGRAGHGVSGWHRLHGLQAIGLTLTDEQKAAFLHITGKEDIAAIVGFAGSGKSTMLGAARAAWAKQGYRVRGAALSGIAADGLQEGAGIDSRTIHDLLFALDKGRDRLTAHDVLVVDEAGMIGSRLMARLLAHARAAGAKVVLVGDAEQLQAIDAGAAFRAIVDRIGAARISTIRRQREAWQQAATRDLATDHTADALDRYEQAGMVHRHASNDDAKHSLIDHWNKARQANPAQSQIILAYTRADVRDLNEQARSRRRDAGELGEDHTLETAQGERQFATGDRLYFLKNDKKLGVRNGSLGTIEAIQRGAGGDRLTVRLDNGKRVSFSLATYASIDHGYAATVHKSQGVTVDRAHVLATRHMDRHAAYVGMTRHRTRLDVHWSADSLTDRAGLARSMSRDGLKDTTLDYAPA